MPSFLRSYAASFSFVGLTVAMLFFALSLTPSLLPRTYPVQGTLSGLALAVGYGLGVFAAWVWHYLEMPKPDGRLVRLGRWATIVAALLVAAFFLWRMTIWQNSIRDLMEMPLLETAHPWRVGLIAGIVATLLVAGGRLFGHACRWAARSLNRVIPRRISNVAGVVIIATALLSFVDGVVVRQALYVVDEAFAELDGLVEYGVEQPRDTRASGSPASLIAWDSIGRRGKDFIARGPTREDLSEFSGKPALQPLRIYVGLNARETERARAELALAEMKRVGAFERSVLVVATPTGTGWLDPSATDTLEYIHNGDTAIVSVAYSYLPSWITILIDPDRSRLAARALFDVIYPYWTSLPRETRPRLYLHGLSLGSLGSESATDLIYILEDLIHGAVWSGPPFPSRTWSAITQFRNPDSPAWLPRFRDGSLIRFTARENALDLPDATWGPLRAVYIQHASDPMVFFSPNLIFQRPDWLIGERGPDVSPYLQWVPIVSFLQIGFDLPMATSVPIGYGHNYAPAAYIDAWVEVTEPENWTAADTERLKRRFID